MADDVDSNASDWVASPKQEIKYSLYQASDATEMTSLLGEAFTQFDPPTVAIGMNPPEFEEIVRLFCPQAANQGLTIVARVVETGEMCGALLTEDSASELPDGIESLSAKCDPVFDILGQLDEEYRRDQSVQPGASIHLFLLGVAQRFAGQGIAHQLVSECLENGILKGYRMAVTEATGKTSQHIFRKQGFVERVRRSYGDYRFDGQATFASIADHGGPILMDKRLALDQAT